MKESIAATVVILPLIFFGLLASPSNPPRVAVDVSGTYPQAIETLLRKADEHGVRLRDLELRLEEHLTERPPIKKKDTYNQ